ncbi:hypothetical protein L484_010654 [Morus notabilis]|uniref:Uncharacterized protein n=1 Tax=Morus notabilis TaxID=981085 RepID=W9RM87_9ROSA|nr:hypothetical protein L484_010654 [Morus notabilis]
MAGKDDAIGNLDERWVVGDGDNWSRRREGFKWWWFRRLKLAMDGVWICGPIGIIASRINEHPTHHTSQNPSTTTAYIPHPSVARTTHETQTTIARAESLTTNQRRRQDSGPKKKIKEIIPNRLCE